MKKRTIKTHPFLVKALFPKGHRMGMKSRESIRTSRCRTLAEAEEEKKDLRACGATTVFIIDKSTKSKT